MKMLGRLNLPWVDTLLLMFRFIDLGLSCSGSAMQLDYHNDSASSYSSVSCLSRSGLREEAVQAGPAASQIRKTG